MQSIVAQGKASPDDVSQLLQALLMNTPQGTDVLKLDNPNTLTGFVQQLNQTLQSSKSQSTEQAGTQLANSLLALLPAEARGELQSSSTGLMLQLQRQFGFDYSQASDVTALANEFASLIKDAQEEQKRIREVTALTPQLTRFAAPGGGYQVSHKQSIVAEFDQPSPYWRQFQKTRQWTASDAPSRNDATPRTPEQIVLAYLVKGNPGPQRQAWASATVRGGSYILADSAAPQVFTFGTPEPGLSSMWPVISQSRVLNNTSSFDFSKDFSLKLRLKALHPKVSSQAMGNEQSLFSLGIKLYGVNSCRFNMMRYTSVKKGTKTYTMWVSAHKSYKPTALFGIFKGVDERAVHYLNNPAAPAFDTEWMDVELTKTGTQLSYSLNGKPVMVKSDKPLTQEIGPVLNRYLLELQPSGTIAIDRIELRHL